MQYKHVNIDVVSYELPPVVLSSDEIEKQLQPVYERLRLPEGRLELMSGIKERRLWLPGTRPSDGAILAGKKALDASSIPADKIGCLAMCSVCRDFLEPATATVVHHGLGLSSDALVFDLSNACLGILTGMIVVANMIETGQIEAGMVVAGENSRSLVESTIKTILSDKTITRRSIKPYFASLTIGSGAVAVILSKASLSKFNHKFLGGVTVARTEYHKLCQGSEDKGMYDGVATLMETDSEELLIRGVNTAKETWDKFQEKMLLNKEKIDLFCTHQVGSAHKRLLFEKLDLDLKNDYSTLEYFGNIGSVSCPITLAKAVEDKCVSDGDIVSLLGIGSGINCSMLGVRW